MPAAQRISTPRPAALGGDRARKPLLSVPEAAEALGVQPATIRSWIYRRRVVYVRVGRSVRVPESEIARIITAGTVPALPEREVGR